jgi:pseudaminic acid synthase
MKELRFIGEISGNHNQDFNLCIKLIDHVKASGCDYVKFQCYTPDSLTIDVDNEWFRVKNFPTPSYSTDPTTYYQLYKASMTPREWFPKLFKYCEEIDIKYIVTPFCIEDLMFLERLGCPHYKIAAYEANDEEFVDAVIKTKKPIYISTGQMGFIEAIAMANHIKKHNPLSCVFHSISKHPTLLSDLNIQRILKLKQYTTEIGFSDHSIDPIVTYAAIFAGAEIIEKHITIDDDSVDGAFSLNCVEMAELISRCKEIYNCLNTTQKDDSTHNRSIFCTQDVVEGMLFTRQNIRVIRPGAGVHPKFYKELLGKKIKRNIKKGEPLRVEDLC